MGITAKQSLRVGIYDPYLDILGGGERYILTIAEYLSSSGVVDIWWKDLAIRKSILERLNINVDRVRFINKEDNFNLLSGTAMPYDLFFYVTDGSLFIPRSSKNFLIIQSPAHIPPMTVSNRIKMRFWQRILCYSEFVKSYIIKEWQTPLTILPPSVELTSIHSGRKENIILSTGRFFSHLHSKKQNFLIEWFIKFLSKVDDADWKLVLIGSVTSDSQEFVASLVKLGAHFPVTVITNAPFDVLCEYYQKAKFFWLATGYGEDLNKFPEKAEHFGIVTVEAMAAGCVPIVYDAGGQREIIENQHSGYLFTTPDELIEYTIYLASHEEKRQVIAKTAQKRSRAFSRDVFLRRLNEIILS